MGKLGTWTSTSPVRLCGRRSLDGPNLHLREQMSSTL